MKEYRVHNEKNDFDSAYSADFRKFVADNPRVLQKVKILIADLDRNKLRNISSDEEGIRIERFDDSIDQKYFKIVVGAQAFFCKENPKSNADSEFGYGGGFGEAVRLEEVKKILLESGIQKVEVVDFKFAFDNTTDTFYVSKWNEDCRTDIYGYIGALRTDKSLSVEQRNEKIKELTTRADQIQSLLESYNFVDINRNMAYSPTTDTIIIFDLKKMKEHKQ